MTIRITEDENETGGFAFVDLGRSTSSPLLSFRRQDAEPRHLGLDGWQPEVAWLAPLSVTERDGRAVARFGPNVVDRIEELVPIEIVAQDGTSFGVVPWPFITPAPAGPGLLAPAASSPPKLTQTGTRSTDASAPDGTTLTSDAVAEPEAGLEPGSVPPDTAPATSLSPTRHGRTGLRIGALVVLIAGVAAGTGGYIYWDAIRTWFEPGTGTGTTRADVPPPPPPAPAEPPAAPEAPRLSAAELRQRHARLLDERAGSAAFVALGDTAIAARQGAPAFRAFEEADPVANADAAWQLARFYDPGTVDGTYREAARPNLTRAAYYYALWRNRSPRHTDALRGLCDANTEAVGRDDRLRTICRP